MPLVFCSFENNINNLNQIIMKKLFLTLIALFGLSAAFAQTVPNASFEEWTDATHPVGWNGTFSANIPCKLKSFT